MINFLDFNQDDFTYLKRDGNQLADNAWEDSQVDEFFSKDYYDLKAQNKFEFSLKHYEIPPDSDVQMKQPSKEEGDQ